MRDLRQLPITGDLRQFAASNEEFLQMMQFRLPPLLLAGVLASSAAVAVDLEKGKEINGTCAACHGDQGAGGKKGEYPRIAGQRVSYIENQLKNFRSRTRVNIPMYPYTQERELSDEDIKDISAYLAGIELSTKMPTFKGTEDALTRLQMVDRVMIIPRAEGNLDRGQAIYQKQCASCHGKTGKGRGMFPMLVGQYTNYLKRQVDLYLKGDRPHDEEGTVGVLNSLKEQDVQDVLAYLASIQEPTE
jgi:cytochrome c553